MWNDPPPSTPPPVALRGALLQQRLVEIVPERPAIDESIVPSLSHDTEAIARVALFTREATFEPPSSEGPRSLRGPALVDALAMLQSVPSSSRVPLAPSSVR